MPKLWTDRAWDDYLFWQKENKRKTIAKEPVKYFV
jgi:Txe/YoeB family toxin of Txe-Axe toxin-antitoxin module